MTGSRRALVRQHGVSAGELAETDGGGTETRGGWRGMKSCPITLEPVEGGSVFSKRGLRCLHPQLKDLSPLPLSGEEQLREARLRADKMSIQGVQPKLSAVLRPKEGRFEIVDCEGRFILKPNPTPFEEVPANEALTSE